MKRMDYEGRDALMQAVAQAVAADLAQALAAKPSVTLAVPGGTTPGPVFDLLADHDLDWARVHVLLTDERWVPEDHASSNAALIRARLLVGRASSAGFTPFFTADADIDSAAAQLSAQLSPRLPLDVVLLGMGADMHTASLFPQGDTLAAALAADAPLLLPVHLAGQDIARITLTAPALQGADAIHLLITGADKRAALETAQTLPASRAPVQVVLPRATVHWSAT